MIDIDIYYINILLKYIIRYILYKYIIKYII